MITMEILGKIRRMYLRDKLSLHEITKQTGLARNTIRTWLRSAEKAAPPTYRRTEGPGKLTAFHAALEQALKADGHRAKRDRRTAKDLFAHIKADGYAGGYSRVTDFIRDWRGREGKTPHAFVPLKFELGEAFQFDWSEEGLVIGGIYRRLQVPQSTIAPVLICAFPIPLCGCDLQGRPDFKCILGSVSPSRSRLCTVFAYCCSAFSVSA